MFSSIDDGSDDKPSDLKDTIMSIIEDDIIELEHIRIQRYRRLPNPKSSRCDGPRNIIVRFYERTSILNCAKKLKGKQPPININPQYSSDIMLLLIKHAAISTGHTASLVEDRLYVHFVDNRLYTVDNITSVPFVKTAPDQ